MRRFELEVMVYWLSVDFRDPVGGRISIFDNRVFSSVILIGFLVTFPPGSFCDTLVFACKMCGFRGKSKILMTAVIQKVRAWGRYAIYVLPQ